MMEFFDIYRAENKEALSYISWIKNHHGFGNSCTGHLYVQSWNIKELKRRDKNSA